MLFEAVIDMTYLSSTHQHFAAVGDDLLRLAGVHERFHDGQTLDAAHVEAVHIVPDYNRVSDRPSPQSNVQSILSARYSASSMAQT